MWISNVILARFYNSVQYKDFEVILLICYSASFYNLVSLYLISIPLHDTVVSVL